MIALEGKYPRADLPRGERNSDSAQSSLNKSGLSGWVPSKNNQRGAINKGIELPFSLEAGFTWKLFK